VVQYERPSADAALEGAVLCLGNARAHRHAARVLTAEKSFGCAVSHLVLGSEEVAKAVILISVGYGVEWDDKYLKVWFTRHWPRHFAGQFTIMLEAVLERHFPRGDMEGMNPGAQLRAAWRMMRFLRKNLVSEIFALGNDPELAKQIEWWGEADELKQRGFYVDYTSGKWRTPSNAAYVDLLLAERYTSLILSDSRLDFLLLWATPRQHTLKFLRRIVRQYFPAISKAFAPHMEMLADGGDA
jgi:AbiV family abortive infection protein